MKKTLFSDMLKEMSEGINSDIKEGNFRRELKALSSAKLAEFDQLQNGLIEVGEALLEYYADFLIGDHTNDDRLERTALAYREGYAELMEFAQENGLSHIPVGATYIPVGAKFQ